MRSNVKCLLFAVALCAACVPFGADARGQDPRPLSFGYEGLRMMLEQQGLEPVQDVRRWKSLPPSQTVLVLMGRAGTFEEVAGNLPAYARAGGAVLAASDRPGSGLGIAVGQGPVTVDDETLAYRGYADCPLMTNVPQAHPLFRNVARLATNRPGYFEWKGTAGSLTPLAWLPPQSRVRDQPLGAKPLIVCGTFGRGGRIVLAADHSLFTNQMLVAEDNLLFAWNCVSWLCDSDQRKYAVFIEDGQPVGRVDIAALLSRVQPSTGPNLPPTAAELPPEAAAELPPASLVVFANALLAGLEDADVFNALAEGQPRGVRAMVFRRGVLLTATCLVVGIAALMVLLSNVHRGRTVHAAAADGPGSEALLPAGELATMMAWQFFCDAGAPLVDDMFSAAPAPPRAEIADGLWQRWRAARNVKRLWRIATRRGHRHLSRRQLEQVAGRICALRRLQAERRLRLNFAPS